MSENLHDIDKLFHDAMEGYEDTPSSKVWAALDHQLDKKNIAQAARKYNKLKFFSAALLLLLLGVITWQLFTRRPAGADNTNNLTNANSISNKTVHPQNSTEKNKANTPEPNAPAPPTAPGAVSNNTENKAANISATMATNNTLIQPGAASGNAAGNNPSTTATEKPNTSTAVKNNIKKASATPGANSDNDTRTTIVNGSKINNGHRNDAKASVNPAAATTTHNNTGGSLNKPANSVATGNGNKSRAPFTKNKLSSTGGDDIIAAGNDIHAAGVNNKRKIKASAKKIAGEEESAVATDASEAAKQVARTTAGANTDNAINTSPKIRTLNPVMIESNTGSLAGDLPIYITLDNNRQTQGLGMPQAAAKPIITKKTGSIHFSVMPFYSPQFSFTRIDEDMDHRRPPFQQGSPREKIKNDETYTSSSSWGIVLAMPLGKKWSVQSGVSYNNRSVVIQPKNIYAQLDPDGNVKYRFDCSSGYTYITPKSGTIPVVGDSISVARSNNNLQYIGVPLSINYTFLSSKKINIIPSLGLMANFLVKQSIQTSLDPASTNQKENITSIQGLRKTYFNGTFGLALQYNFSKKVALQLAPGVNLALNSINQNAAVKSYLNSYSVAGGIKIQF